MAQIALCFPAVHALIDWSYPHELLDAQLQRITGDSTIGRRYADRLVKVWSPAGAEVRLLLHMAISAKAQAQLSAALPGRGSGLWPRSTPQNLARAHRGQRPLPRAHRAS